MLFGHQNDTKQPEPVAPISPAPSEPIVTPVVTNGVNPLAVDPATGASLPVAPLDSADNGTPSVLNQPMPTPPSPDGSMPSASPVAPVMLFPATPTDPIPSATADDLDESTDSSAVSFDTATPATSVTDPAPVTSPSTDVTPVETPETAPEVDASAETPTSDTSLDMPVTAEADDTSTSDNASVEPTDPATDDLLELKQQALAELGPLVDQLEQTPTERFRTTMMMIQSTDNQSLIPRAYEAAQAITDEKVRAQALLDVVNEINYFTQQKPAGQ